MLGKQVISPTTCLCALQVFLLGLHPTPCRGSHLWPEVYAQSQKQLGGKAGCGPCMVLSSVCPGLGTHRCCKHTAGRLAEICHCAVLFLPMQHERVTNSVDENTTLAWSLCRASRHHSCDWRSPVVSQRACMQGSSPQLLATWWRLAYWYGFAVQFTVLPFHQEYADSGHFTVGDRIRTAIRNNLIFYAVLVVGPCPSIAVL